MRSRFPAISATGGRCAVLRHVGSDSTLATSVRFLYTGSLLLLLAYVGSRFVLEVVLGRAAP